jgi:hypothetical protein
MPHLNFGFPPSGPCKNPNFGLTVSSLTFQDFYFRVIGKAIPLPKKLLFNICSCLLD